MAFDELQHAVSQHGQQTREYVQVEQRLLAHLDAPPRRRTGSWTSPGKLFLVLIAALSLILPVLYVGGTQVTGLRQGDTWVRPVQPAPPANCSASNVTCITSNQGKLSVSTSNRTYDCQGHTLSGVEVHASGVTIQHCVLIHCPGWCAWIQGGNNTFQDNDVSQVYWDSSVSDDMDATRFFGSNTRMLRNRMHDILDDREGGNEHGAHFDCIQNYSTVSAGGGSSNILIEGNSCSSIHFHQCVIGEGPDSTDGGGGGGGVARDWLVQDNFFDCGYGTASQSLKFDDIDNVTLNSNMFTGNGSTGKKVTVTSLSSGFSQRNNVPTPTISG